MIKLTREQKIGLFSIVTLALIYMVINYLRGEDLFGKSKNYCAVYESVEGLATTGPVYIKGLKVGTVESIDYIEEKDNFIVSFKIDSKYKISDSCVAQIYSSDLLGGKALRINMLKGTRYLKEGDTLSSSIEPALLDMFSKELIPLKDSATTLIGNMNKTFQNVNDVLDGKNKDNLAQSLDNLNKALKSVRSIAQNLDSNSPEISSILDNLNKISISLNGSMAHLDNGLNNFSVITDSLKQADLAGTVESLKRLISDLNNPKGSIGKLIQTDSLHTSVNSLVRDLEVLVNNINRDPKKYIKISVF